MVESSVGAFLRWCKHRSLTQSLSNDELIVLPHRNMPAGVLGGLVDCPRVYYIQFRGFESHRVPIRREIFLA